MVKFRGINSFALVFFIFSLSTASSDEVKNVLLLVADDAAFEMGAYLNRFCQTPNLDKLAKQSLIFNNAYTSVSSCSPSRAQLLTGLASHQNGMYGLHNDVHHFNVFDRIKSIPNVLSLGKEHNIYTGLIGKKHIGPDTNFKFDFEETEEKHSINQIGRNITNIKNYVGEFLDRVEGRQFFLMVAFHDPHRCGHITPEYGEFCERFGSGEIGMGTIPDWKPIYYDWRNLPTPDQLQDTETVRKELAAQYMTISRLDQGVGLVLKELHNHGFDRDTLVIYTSDNGPPYPGGRTNFYDYGIREPMIIYSPDDDVRRNSVTYVMSSLLDVYPTILDAFHIQSCTNHTNSPIITGKSLLPLLKNEPKPDPDEAIFGSQNFHEVTMTYPMRMIRTKRYKLIHNINYQLYFPIDQDLYTSPTFQEVLNLTMENQPIPWIRTLKTFYERPEWEMFDLKMDPLEQRNLADKESLRGLRHKLEERLRSWQRETKDPWQCAPHDVLEDKGPFKEQPQCLTLGHKSLNG